MHEIRLQLFKYRIKLCYFDYFVFTCSSQFILVYFSCLDKSSLHYFVQTANNDCDVAFLRIHCMYSDCTCIVLVEKETERERE